MADRDLYQNRMSYPYHQQGSRSREFDERNERNELGYNQSRAIRRDAGDYRYEENRRRRSYQEPENYNRINYFPDNDENRPLSERDYEYTQYGTSGTYGYRGEGREDIYGSYSPVYERRTGMNRPGRYSGREDWGRGYVNADLGSDFDERTRSAYGIRDTAMGRTDKENNYRGRGPRNYQRSEERIREDVCDRLTDDAWVDASHIEVQVKDRDVVLSGTVENRDQKRRAEDLVETIGGVENVMNNIKVEKTEMNDYTGNTDHAGGIGDKSGTMHEVMRDERKK